MDKNNLAVPIAIVVAGLLIAGAVMFGGGESPTNPNNGQTQDNSFRQISDERDWIMGNPDADIVLIEYSDLECPFCKSFHFTLERIMDEYGKDGKVAWVFRQFPIPQLHSKAPQEALAAQCAGIVGGDAKFFQYITKVFEETPSNNGLDLDLLPKFAQEMGLNMEAYNACLESDDAKKQVEEDYADGVKAGVRGTPHTLIYTKDGKVIPMEGGQPYENVKAAIDLILSEI